MPARAALLLLAATMIGCGSRAGTPATRTAPAGDACSVARTRIAEAHAFFASDLGSIGNARSRSPVIPPRGPIGGAIMLGALAIQSASGPASDDYLGRRRDEAGEDAATLLRGIGGDLLLESEEMAAAQAAVETLATCPDIAQVLRSSRVISARVVLRGALLDRGVSLVAAEGTTGRLLPGAEARRLAESTRQRREALIASLQGLEAAATAPQAAAAAETAVHTE